MCNDFISLIQILCSLPTLYQSGILRVYFLDPPYLLTVSCITGGSVGIRSPQIRFSVGCEEGRRIICRGRNSNPPFPQTTSDFENTSVICVSHFCFQRIDSLCAAAVAHPSVTTSAISSRRLNDMEIIGTKSLPACHGMQSVLYIHMYWTQTCHRLWQPHSSHTKPILSAAQCLPPSLPLPPSKWQHWNEH